jgi:hypothetical protein
MNQMAEHEVQGDGMDAQFPHIRGIHGASAQAFQRSRMKGGQSRARVGNFRIAQCGT